MMFDKSRIKNGVSPVVAVILMVAVTVILAAVIGTFVLDLGGNVQENPNAGVSFSQDFNNSVDTTDDNNNETDLYDVTAKVISIDNADQVNMTTDGSSVAYYPDTSTTGEATKQTKFSGASPATNTGETMTISGVQEGDSVTIIGELNGKETVLQSYTVGE